MNISEFNINAEFIACNHITTNELNPLVEKPYHTKASIFALCTKGVLKTIINHTQFRVEANTLLVIPPETFVQLLHTSDDAEIYVVIFSQQLIQSAGAGKLMMDKFHIIGKHYIFPLSKTDFQLYAEFMTYLSHLYQRTESPSSLVSLQTLLTYLLQGISELCPERPRIKETPGSRHFNQYRIFIRLVHTDYVREHQVSYYALKTEYETGSSLPPCQKGIRTYSHGNHQQYYHHGCQSTTLYRQHSDKGYSRESRF